MKNIPAKRLSSYLCISLRTLQDSMAFLATIAALVRSHLRSLVWWALLGLHMAALTISIGKTAIATLVALNAAIKIGRIVRYLLATVGETGSATTTVVQRSISGVIAADASITMATVVFTIRRT